MAFLKKLKYAPRAFRARAFAARHGLPGLDLDAYGRRLGLRLAGRGDSHGVELLVHPIDSVRYFEFGFAARALPAGAKECLDVSSPRLFSLWMAETHPGVTVDLLNPDAADLGRTERTVRKLGIDNVRCRVAAVEGLDPAARFDAIWSISVVEHIPGDGDTAAVRRLHDALRPGAPLILTVPVARAFTDEYRERDVYGLGRTQERGRYFFQHQYDEGAIGERLVSAAPWAKVELRWFGEREPGTWQRFEERWMADGFAAIVEDARFVAEQFQEFPSFSAMPGVGVCGLVLTRAGAAAAR
jgi:SAM-dependent methyltransferase